MGPSKPDGAASRLRRARRTNGVWGPCRGPQNARPTEPRHGSAGARRTFGGLGAMSWPPNLTGMKIGDAAGHPSTGEQASMSVLQDLRKFVRQHRACGVLTIHLEPPSETTYRIEIGCRSCDAALTRTVDPAAAAWDLLHTDLLLAAN